MSIATTNPPSGLRLAGPGTSPATLPAPLTATIGRTREIDDVCHLVGGSRLVTLTGAGGSGKTRMAIEAARRLVAAFEHGVRWVDLAPLHEPSRVAEHVATALCIREDRGCTSLDAVLATLGNRSMLVVLDNCEHLVQACAELAEMIVRACPQVRLLATSREALGVSGETAWLVPALSLPPQSGRVSADTVLVSEAGQLFLDRARAVLPSFAITDANAAAIARICRRLDGIPLAIELAAARTKVLAPEQIAERLDDSFRLLTGGGRTTVSRHRTLREAIDWSFALLSPREQCLLRRLAVFDDGFSLDAAETVCADTTLLGDAILDTLSALVDKSLVLMEAVGDVARYRLLETVRQYGCEHLRAAGEEDALRHRHATFYLALAEEAEPHIFAGAGDSPWIARLDLDNGNLRAVADWAEEDPSRVELTLRLLAALHWYWFAKGRFHEGRQRLDSALDRSSSVAPLVRGRASTALASIVFWQGDYGSIRAPAEDAVANVRESGDERAIVYALTTLGMATLLDGNPTDAGIRFAEAVERSRALGPTALVSFTLYWQGIAAHARGEFQLAHASFDEATAVGRAVRCSPAIAHPLSMRARIAIAEDDLSSARRWLSEALAIHCATGDGFGTVVALDGVARVASAAGEPVLAARLLGASEALRDVLAMARPLSEQGDYERLVARSTAALGAERFETERRTGYSTPLEDAVTAALAELSREVPRGTARSAAEEAQASATVAADPGPQTLRVLALGPLQIFRGDRLLDASAWGSAKPRELLLFLLCHAEGCTKDQVGLAFWPDASTAQVRNSFHVTLHRLRKALGGVDWIVSTGDRYRVADHVRCEFDAARFEREVPVALRALKRREAGAAARLEELLALYRGDFLDGEGMGDWHLERRDHLQRLCVDCLLALGDWLAEQERYVDAAAAFERLLTRDDVNEEGYRRLMLSHARAGARPQALRAYHRLAKVLADELETEPDRATRALFEKLQAGERV